MTRDTQNEKKTRSMTKQNGVEVSRSVDVQPVISTDHREPEEPDEGEPQPPSRGLPPKIEPGRFQKSMGM